MKEFDLEKALAGEPVKLRDGSKAYVRYDIADQLSSYESYSRLFGFVVKNNKYDCECSWSIEGKYFYGFDYDEDIIGMWEESKQPRITLELPAPLKEPREGMFYIEFGIIYQS
ncbi:hypothetical protein ACERCG_05745 [Mannheimia sp. E30BD]|uniref:hypothetical protein n=1 Tax=Mannheimia sp. E30BD TaxID=3278708 RepID=UPI00359ED4B3